MLGIDEKISDSTNDKQVPILPDAALHLCICALQQESMKKESLQPESLSKKWGSKAMQDVEDFTAAAATQEAAMMLTGRAADQGRHKISSMLVTCCAVLQNLWLTHVQTRHVVLVKPK